MLRYWEESTVAAERLDEGCHHPEWSPRRESPLAAAPDLFIPMVMTNSIVPVIERRLTEALHPTLELSAHVPHAVEHVLPARPAEVHVPPTQAVPLTQQRPPPHWPHRLEGATGTGTGFTTGPQTPLLQERPRPQPPHAAEHRWPVEPLDRQKPPRQIPEPAHFRVPPQRPHRETMHARLTHRPFAAQTSPSPQTAHPVSHTLPTNPMTAHVLAARPGAARFSRHFEPAAQVPLRTDPPLPPHGRHRAMMQRFREESEERKRGCLSSVPVPEWSVSATPPPGFVIAAVAGVAGLTTTIATTNPVAPASIMRRLIV